MSMNKATLSNPRRILPPKALLLALLVQMPLIILRWPIAPRLASMLAGLLALGAGVALNVSAERLFRTSQVGVCPFSPAAMLIERGPYRFTRNPMYLGMILVSATPALLSNVLMNLFAALSFTLWIHWRFVKPEEAYLHSLFGDIYDQYRDRVPCWFRISIAVRALSSDNL
jgi:protein-S-isoprenylcysteine O-methyltransferase Ste14